MANTLITPDVLAPEATLVLKNEAILFNAFRNPSDEARFTGDEKVGDTIKIVSPSPGDVRVFTGTATSRDLTESTTDLVVERHFYDKVTITSQQWSLDLKDFSAQVVQPIMKDFAEELANYAAEKLDGIGHFTGTAGAPPSTKAEITELDRLMNTNKAPGGRRMSIVDEFAKASIVAIDGFSDANRRGDAGTTLRTANIGEVYGFDWFMDQSIPDHVTGTMAAESPLVDEAADVLEGATSMDIDDVGAGSQTILIGDLFTVANVPNYTGVFTNNTTAVAGQITGATFTPPAPVGGFLDDAAITIEANHTKNVAFSPGAFTAVTFPPPASRGAAESSAFFDASLGFGVRVTFDWDSSGIADTILFDLLAGCAVRQQDLAAILLG